MATRALTICFVRGSFSAVKLIVTGASGAVIVLALFAVGNDGPHYQLFVIASVVAVAVDVCLSWRAMSSSLLTMNNWQIPALWAPLGVGAFFLVFFLWGAIPAFVAALVVGGLCPGTHRYLRDRRAARRRREGRERRLSGDPMNP